MTMKLSLKKPKIRHSRRNIKTKNNISSKSNLWNYKWNTTMPLEKLITLWNKIYNQHASEHNPELEHSLEDDILIKFVLEIENGTILEKDIHRIARLIKTHILDKKRGKWYSG
jgi:hypothetical protein